MLSTVVVMETAFPLASTMTKWEVPAGSRVASAPTGAPPAASRTGPRRAGRGQRRALGQIGGSSSPSIGTFTKSGSPM